MTRTVLSLRSAPPLRLDVRSLSPAALAPLSVEQIERLPLPYGNRLVPLAEWFTVSRDDAAQADHDGGGDLRFEGDTARCDRIGWQITAGRIVVDGAAGDYVGGGMSGGAIRVAGDAGLLAACEMSGGVLDIAGNAGDFAAAGLPGSMDGMRGGTLLVRGDAGARFGDRMRRGSALVFGGVGDFAASRMVAGTIAIGGAAGAHVGYGMRRGSVVLLGAERVGASVIGPTFSPLIADAPVFWQLLARDLARHGGPFAALASRRVDRFAGDLSAAGKGELIVVR